MDGNAVAMMTHLAALWTCLPTGWSGRSWQVLAWDEGKSISYPYTSASVAPHHAKNTPPEKSGGGGGRSSTFQCNRVIICVGGDHQMWMSSASPEMGCPSLLDRAADPPANISQLFHAISCSHGSPSPINGQEGLGRCSCTAKRVLTEECEASLLTGRVTCKYAWLPSTSRAM